LIQKKWRRREEELWDLIGRLIEETIVHIDSSIDSRPKIRIGKVKEIDLNQGRIGKRRD